MQQHDMEHAIVSERRPPLPGAPRRSEYWLLALAGAAALGIGLYSWWLWRSGAEPAAVPAATQQQTQSEPAEKPEDRAAPAVRYPVEPGAKSSAAPSLDASDAHFANLLQGILGREAMDRLRMTHFVRHFVATVDNLGRERAPSRMWPVDGASGRFSTVEQGDRIVVDAANDARYLPWVLLLESADAPRLVALYRSSYPLFQQAYEELGYPRRYFNDRLVEVIDHLLAAPEPDGPIVLESVAVRGPVQLTRPWVHYSFADPRLESLSAGQKMMVRVGLDNERRLKAQLKRFRAALVASGSR